MPIIVENEEHKVNAETAAFWHVTIGCINLLVLIATVVVLIFYTRYTYNMQKAV